jgi:hypothetical protein
MKRSPGLPLVRTSMVVAAAVAAAIVPLPASAVERFFSRGLYPAMQPRITYLSNLVPIALLDLALAGVLVGGIIAVARNRRSTGWRGRTTSALLLMINSAAIIYLLFLAVWGLNYRRIPLEQKLDFDRARVTRTGALQLAAEAVRRVNSLHADAHALPVDPVRLRTSFASGERALGMPGTTRLGQPKRSLFGFYFREASVDGMTDPLFLEVILNPDLLPVELPEVLAHEWAHLAGFADESEANFLAWLACLRGDPLARYSGWLSAYRRVSSALPREQRATLPRLDSGPRDDLRAIAARMNRASPALRRAANNMYDSYLRANGIQEGIANYDLVLQLMLGTKLGSDWDPR